MRLIDEKEKLRQDGIDAHPECTHMHLYANYCEICEKIKPTIYGRISANLYKQYTVEPLTFDETVQLKIMYPRLYKHLLENRSGIHKFNNY